MVEETRGSRSWNDPAAPIRVKSIGGERELQRADIQKLLGVDEIVRIPSSDYPNIALAGDIYSHFNLPLQHDRSGYTVVLPSIVAHGHFVPTVEEHLPLLSFNDIWRAEVVGFERHLSYEQVTPEHLANCIGGANSAEALKLVMANRYKKTLPHLSVDEIIAQGVSYTKLKLLNRVTLNA